MTGHQLTEITVSKYIYNTMYGELGDTHDNKECKENGEHDLHINMWRKHWY